MKIHEVVLLAESANTMFAVSEAKAVKQRLDPKCWTGKHKEGTKIKGGVRVNNCVPNESVEEEKAGLYANLHAKRERIKHGSGEHMRKPGTKGAPTAQSWKDAAKTAKTEAANPAQQAAIAIAKKKSGKYDKEGKRIKETQAAKQDEKEFKLVRPGFWKHHSGESSIHYGDDSKSYRVMHGDEKDPMKYRTLAGAHKAVRAKHGVKEGETGSKFTGYWKGTDKGKPGKKMVGDA